MRTSIALLLFCCFAFVQKAAAQAIATDSASAAKAAHQPTRTDRLRAMRAMRPVLRPASAPFPGKPAGYARYDTRGFKLSKALVSKVRDGEIAATSDYFKPDSTSTRMPELLSDSAYVKDYRYYAYNMGVRQMKHPVGTGLIIGGSVLVVITGIVLILVALSPYMLIFTSNNHIADYIN